VLDVPASDPAGNPAGEQVEPENNAEENPDEVITGEGPVTDEPGPIDNLEVDIDDESENIPEDEKPSIVTKEDTKGEEKTETKPAEQATTKPAESKPVTKPAPKPAPKPAATPAAKPVQEPAVTQQPEAAKPAPAVMYRVRKSANDAKSQIGAFADFMKAKRFAIGNASDGYKVFDMEGNLVFAP